MTPNFKHNHGYTILNGHGKFLYYGVEDRQFELKDPEKDSYGEEVFIVHKLGGKQDHISLTVMSGPSMMTLKDRSDGATVRTKIQDSPSSMEEWVVEDASNSTYSGFCRLMNLHTKTYLDVDDNDDSELIGAVKHNRGTQRWKFIHIEGENENKGAVERYTELHHEQKKFLKEKKEALDNDKELDETLEILRETEGREPEYTDRLVKHFHYH